MLKIHYNKDLRYTVCWSKIKNSGEDMFSQYKRKYSIRKLSVMAVSVFIGLGFMGGAEAEAQTLKAGADLRASEQAATGYFRSGADTDGDGISDGKHIRPDGSEWGTAFTYLKQVSTRGENMGQLFATEDLRELVSEAYLAKKQFELFKSSPEHYANIMDPRHNVGYFSFGLSDDHKILVANKERPEHTSAEQVNGQGVIFTQVFGRKRAIPLP